MAVLGRKVTVDTTANGTLLTTGQGGSGPLNIGDFGASLYNNGLVTVFLGGFGVTAALGYPLAPGLSIDVGQLGADDAVYGITSSSSADVRVLEFT